MAGRAAQEPLIEEDPFAPENRRISITLLRKNALPRPKEEPIVAPAKPKAPLEPQSLLENGD